MQTQLTRAAGGNIMETILTILSSNVFIAFASYIMGKRKRNADTDNQILNNLEISINLYKEIIDDLKKEIESLNIKIQHLESRIEELHAENKKLKSSL